MTARRTALRFLCLLLPAAALAAQARSEGGIAPPAASSPAERISPVRLGRLPNGLRFAILPRSGSEPGVALLMRVAGGFLAERRPGERGLAHLIEHIAFESPTRGAPDDFRRIRRVAGPLTLPAPSAGTTSWGETNYFLSTRTAAPADLAVLLGLFREIVGELTFRTDAVDAQRADVMREMAGRKPGNIAYADYVAAVAPGSPNDLLDAQNSDDVPTASVATIRALYHRLYRPDRTMIVIVGAVDPAGTEALIRGAFGDWRGTGPLPAPLPVPTLRADRIAPVSYSGSGGWTGAMIGVTQPIPGPPRGPVQQMRATLMDLLAVRAVDALLSHVQPGADLTIENGDFGYRLLRLATRTAPGQWRPATLALKRTSCDLAARGLSDPEWDAAKQAVIGDLEQRVRTIATVPNVELAKDVSHAVAAGRDWIAPDALLLHARTWFPSLGVRSFDRWWRAQWRNGTEHIRVESPELARVANPLAVIRAPLDPAFPTHGACSVRRS